ncbi:MAG: ATP-binding protein [Chloroflexi bacterium]|nr:ATP-binding protein [Chloroflexota bacterium]
MPARAHQGSLVQELTRTNPWWRNPRWETTDQHLLAATRAPYQRQPVVLDDIASPNLYTLRGPRRVGKSTLLKQTVTRLCGMGIDPRRICYFAADALSSFTDLINLFQADRLLFPDLGDEPRYFLIDEVTAIPEWQRGIKWVRDNTPAAGDCIVATGSSARDIAAGSVHLAGRRGPDIGLDRLLLPMSFAEFTRCAGYALPELPRITFNDFYTDDGRTVCQDGLVHLGTLVDAFEAYLFVGGFPQAVADFRRLGQVSDGFARDLWDVAQADLRAMGLSQPEQGLRLLERLSASLTGPVVLRSLAAELGVSHPAAGDWIGALADAYLVLVLFQETGGVPDVRKQRKVYPIDPFIAHLPARRLPGAYEPGLSQLAEAALAVALFRAVEGDAVDRFGRPGHLFFYRTPGGGEVDFVVLPGPRAAESKYIDTASTREARAIVSNFGGGLLLTRSAIDLRQGVTILPAALFAWLLDQRG